MSEEADVQKRSGRDPILMIGTIILAVAFLVVISGHVIGQFSSDDNEPMKYGDKVKVDYVGSYYGYYDEGGFIFDTSQWDVAMLFGNDSGEEPFFSWEFTEKTESKCVPFNVSIGSGGALMPFEKAIIGLKPGDQIRVAIEAKDGYGIVPAAKQTDWEKTVSMPMMETMSVRMFKATSDITDVTPRTYSGLQHPYGWTSDAFFNSNGTVTVTHNVADGGVYKMSGDKIDVTTDLKGDGTFDVTFDIDFESSGSGEPDEIKLIEIKSGGKTYYITHVYDSPGSPYFTTKSTDEKTGMMLYFVIIVVGYQ
jgi:FKBP-type peptidyl-prolyl cis-trans isomerase 2